MTVSTTTAPVTTCRFPDTPRPQNFFKILANQPRTIPNDFRRVLDAQARMRAAGLDPEAAEMAAFEENARDLARVGGS